MAQTRKTPEKEPEAAAPPAPDPAPAEHPAVPVSRIRIRDDSEPVRAGGHVLTERGWVPEVQS